MNHKTRLVSILALVVFSLTMSIPALQSAQKA